MTDDTPNDRHMLDLIEQEQPPQRGSSMPRVDPARQDDQRPPMFAVKPGTEDV